MIRISVPPEFLEKVTFHRFDAGSYVDGVWVDGVVTDILTSASVQPLTHGDYRLLPEGNSSQRGWKVFWNQDFQLGQDGLTRADEMTFNGVRHRLAHKEEWQNHGYSAGAFLEMK